MGRPVPNADQQKELDRLEAIPHDLVIGIDEVGCGPLAGPLTIGGVVVRRGWDHPMALDSKALSPKRRKESVDVVMNACLAHVILSLEAPALDAEGIIKARERLTREAAVYLSQKFEAVIVQDGTVPAPVPGRDHTNMVWMAKADALVPAVSAASIIAKVWRDTEMVNYHEIFPYYFWQANKGYGTKAHYAGLAKYGPCVLHRFSYKPIRDLAKRLSLKEYEYRCRGPLAPARGGR